MIIRIVKMSFRKECVDTFLDIFHNSKDKIAGFEGCRQVELLRDKQQRHIFFTYSQWDSEDHLNRYRNSALFEQVWKKTKALFAEKTEAWTLEKGG